MTQMRDRKINSTVYVKVLTEPMKLLLIVSHSKVHVMGDHIRQRKNI